MSPLSTTGSASLRVASHSHKWALPSSPSAASPSTASSTSLQRSLSSTLSSAGLSPPSSPSPPPSRPSSQPSSPVDAAGWQSQLFPLDDSSLPLRCRTVLLSGSDVSAKRAELRHYFHATFSLYESLFALLASDEAHFEQPDRLRHPLIFYFGHTAGQRSHLHDTTRQYTPPCHNASCRSPVAPVCVWCCA